MERIYLLFSLYFIPFLLREIKNSPLTLLSIRGSMAQLFLHRIGTAEAAGSMFRASLSGDCLNYNFYVENHLVTYFSLPYGNISSISYFHVIPESERM